MSRPYRINWLAANPTGLGAAQTYSANAALILNDTTANLAYPSPTQSPPFPVPTPVNPALPVNPAPNVPQANLYGPINYNGKMPQDNIRTVTLTGSVASSAAVNFTIYGLDETGMFVTEAAITGPTATTTVSFRRHYYKVLAIIPSANATGGALVSVGYGGQGYTMPFQVDYWRKQMQMSFIVENYIAGATSPTTTGLLPQITLDQGQLFQNGYMVPQAQTWMIMPGVLDEYIKGPTGAHPPTGTQGTVDFTAVFPLITGNYSWSLRSYPVVGTRILVNDIDPPAIPTYTTSFTLVTLQQGGR